MSDNFFANWTSADDEEQKRRAWEALASQSDEAPHRTLANQVQLPEVDVVAERPMRSPDMDFTAPGNEPADFAPVARGNIDLGNRPHVRNPDGSTSTVYSMGENIDGKEMLLPGVNDLGYVMTPDQAREEYLRTGKHLGQFADSATSDAAAQLLHLRQEAEPPADTLRGRGGPGYDLTPPEPDLAPGTDAQKSPELPPDAPPLARLGASLQQRDAAPAPPPAEYKPPEYHSSDEGQTTWKGTALAALADILLNRGRGVGGVLALGAQGQSPMAKAELDLKRAQAEKLRNPTYGHQTDPQALELRRRALDLQESGQADARARAEARAKGNDPDGKKAAALNAFYAAHGVDTSGMETLDYSTLIKVRPDVSKLFTNAIAPETNQVAADRATGVKQAEGVVRDERAPREADNAALRAGAEARARTPSAIEIKQTPGAAPLPPNVPEPQQVGIPGSHVEDANVYGSNIGNPAQRAKLTEIVSGVQTLDQAVSKMRQVREKTGMALLPGEQKSAYDAAYGEAIGALTQLYHSGVLNESEYKRYKEQLPTLSPHVTDVLDAVQNRSGKGHQDTVGAQLKGFQDETRSLNSTRLHAYGIAPDWADQQAAAPPPAAGAAVAPVDNLGNTGTGHGRSYQGAPRFNPYNDEELKRLGLQ